MLANFSKVVCRRGKRRPATRTHRGVFQMVQVKKRPGRAFPTDSRGAQPQYFLRPVAGKVVNHKALDVFRPGIETMDRTSSATWGRSRETGGLGPAIAIAFLAIGVYLPAWNGEFVFDDVAIYLTNNALLYDPWGLLAIWSPARVDFPLTHSMFWIEWQLVGKSPWFYHLNNFLLHAATTVVLYLLLERLRLPWPWLVAACFAVHPLQVETVAWISQRKALLGTLFGYAAAYDYLGFHRTGNRWCLGRSQLWFGLSLVGKPVLIMLPIILLGAELVIDHRLWRQAIGRVSGFFLVALVFGAIGTIAQQQYAAADVRGQDLMARLATVGWAAWFYVFQTFRIGSLSFIYPRWQVDGLSLTSWLPNLCLVAVTGWFWWRRRRTGLLPLRAWLVYLLTIFPALGLIDAGFWRYSYVADHYVYQSLPALLVLVADGLRRGFDFLAVRFDWFSRYRNQLAPGLGIGVVGVLAVASFWRSTLFQSEEAIWRETLGKNPQAAIAWLKVGQFEREQGNGRSGLRAVQHAVELDPTLYEGWTQLGEVLRDQEKWEEAAAAYRHVLDRVSERNIEHRLLASTGLAGCLIRLEHPSAATVLADATAAELATLVVTGHGRRWVDLLTRSRVYQIAAARRLGDVAGVAVSESALRDHLQAFPASRPSAAIAFEEMNDLAAAWSIWQVLLMADADQPETNGHAGRVALQRGDLSSAIQLLEKAASNPQADVQKHARVLCNLGIARATKGEFNAAIQAFERSLGFVDGDTRVLQNLALALGLAGRYAESINVFRQIVAVEPANVASLCDLARMLATSPVASQKTAREAVKFATRACELTRQKRPEPWDVLAAAQAKSGDFAAARMSCQRAIEIAVAVKSAPQTITAMKHRLAEYEGAEQPGAGN